MVRTLMIYLDNNASTPLDPRVRDVYINALNTDFANASNELHELGQSAARAVEDGRGRIAKHLGRDHREIIFTSGATEALTLGILGSPAEKPNILISAIEHSAVLEAAKLRALKNGGEVLIAPVNSHGEIDADKWSNLLDQNVGIAVAIVINNETGVIAPIAEISRLTRSKGVVLIGDSTQALGKLANSRWSNEFDVLCISSHKIHGPKGIGVLVLPRDLQKNFESLIPGGGQQKSIRGGTYNAPGIAALAEAVSIASEEQFQYETHFENLSEEFLRVLEQSGIDFSINGEKVKSVPNTLNLQIPGVDGEELILKTPEIAISLGSACHAGFDTPSHVLTAMGLSRKQCEQSFRVSFGRQNTKDEVIQAAELISNSAIRILEGHK